MNFHSLRIRPASGTKPRPGTGPRRRFAARWAAGLLLFSPWLAAQAEITLHQDFDSGALLVDQSYVSGNRVYLKGPDNFNTNRWKWFHFRAEGVAGRQLQFRIDDNFASGSSRLGGKKMVYREEGGEWEFFDQNIWDGSAGHYTFYNDAPFTADTVWVAYSFPYPFGRVQSHVEAIRESPWVFPTESSNANLVIGGSPSATDDRGRLVPSLPLYGYLITDPASMLEKERIVLCSGVHSNEVLAGFVLEGLVNWLVSDDPRAAALRREVEFYVYPMVVPGGRYAGYNRGGPQHPGRDTNRFWREDLYHDMDDIRQIAEAMKKDTGATRVSWVFDFHSWSNSGDHFVIMNSPAHQSVFWQELKRLEPRMGSDVASPGSTNPTTRWFALNRLGAKYGLIPETMFRPGEYPGRFIAMGERFGIALFHEVAPALELEPAAEILLLVEGGHAGESSVRALGAWIENARFGKYNITYSADLEVDVLNSATTLSPEQREILESFDLILMPRYGVGSSGNFASRDWNEIPTPLILMNPFMVTEGTRWGWVPAGTATATTPAIQHLTPVDPSASIFDGVDASAGSIEIYRDPDSTMQVAVNSSLLTGTTFGWTDRADAGGELLHYPWIVAWEAEKEPFYHGGNQVPGGRRMLFLGPLSNSPDRYTADGQQILLNAIDHLLANPPAGFAAWLDLHFDAAEKENPAISGPAADPDGDGLPNLLEYLLGGDPGSPERSPLPGPEVASLMVDGLTNDYLTLTVRRRADLSGLSLKIEASGELSDWDDEAVLVATVSHGDGTLTETYRDVVPVGAGGSRFLRLRVELVE